MLARRLVNVARSARVSVAAPSMRYFSDEPLTIPTDRDQQGGRRKEELEAYERGEEAFDHRRSLVPPDDAGTKENPIMVPSGMAKRTVGFENPATHQLVWFNLFKDNVAYVPDINLYFKLKSTA